MPEGENCLESLLEELRRAGSHDSEGRFTLDAARARALLREHQLADPEHYVLAILTSAVAAGATSIEVRASSRGVRIRYDGTPLTRYELDNLFSWLLLSEREQQHLRDLALAVNAALNLRAEAVVVRCFDGRRCLAARYREQGVHLEEQPSDKPPATVVEVKRSAAALGPGAGGPEAELLERCFPHSSVPIRVNGRTISGPVPAGPWLCFRHLATDRPERWLHIPVDSARAAVEETEVHPAPFSIVAMLGPGAEQATMEFILYGRSYVAPLPWDIPGLAILAATDRISRDLSQSSLVENDVYGNLRKVIEQQVQGMLASLAQHRDRLSLEQARAAMPYLTFLSDGYLKSWEHQSAAELLAWMRQVWHRLSPPDPVRSGLASYKLALLAYAQGDSQRESLLTTEAEALWANLRDEGHYFVDGQRMDARSYVRWQKALAVEAILGPEHPYLLQVLEESSRLAEKRYHYLEAERFQRWRLAVCERMLPGEDPKLLDEYLAYGRILVAANQFHRARPVYRQALARYVANAQGRHEVLREIFVRLATIEMELGNLDEAVDLLARCTGLLHEAYGPQSTELRLVLSRLAETLERMGRGEEARSYRSWIARLPQRGLHRGGR